MKQDIIPQQSLDQLRRHLFSTNARQCAMRYGYKDILREFTVKRHTHLSLILYTVKTGKHGVPWTTDPQGKGKTGRKEATRKLSRPGTN